MRPPIVRIVATLAIAAVAATASAQADTRGSEKAISPPVPRVFDALGDFTIEDDLGIGTESPSQEIDIVDDTPNIQFDATGAPSFGWFLTADSTTFALRQGFVDEDENVLALDVDGFVGAGTVAPAAPLDVVTATKVGFGNSMLLLRRTGGPLAFQLKDDDTGAFWNITMTDNATGFRFSRSGTGVVEMELDSAGNLYLQGDVFTDGQKITPLAGLTKLSADNQRLQSRVADLERRLATLEALLRRR